MIADADTGYGNSINVIRTVHEYEAAGVAAIHLEDQVMPKKCGHMEGKQVVPAGEMAAKVPRRRRRAALARLPDHRANRRARGGGSGRRAGARAALPRRGRRRAVRRGAAVDRGDRGVAGRSPTCRCCSTTPRAARRPPVTHDVPARARLQARDLPDDAAARRRPGRCGRRWRGSSPTAPRSSCCRRLLPFDEFLDFIGIAEIRELEQRFAEG